MNGGRTVLSLRDPPCPPPESPGGEGRLRAGAGGGPTLLGGRRGGRPPPPPNKNGGRSVGPAVLHSRAGRSTPLGPSTLVGVDLTAGRPSPQSPLPHTSHLGVRRPGEKQGAAGSEGRFLGSRGRGRVHPAPERQGVDPRLGERPSSRESRTRPSPWDGERGPWGSRVVSAPILPLCRRAAGADGGGNKWAADGGSFELGGRH